jgi:hypothetical protein
MSLVSFRPCWFLVDFLFGVSIDVLVGLLAVFNVSSKIGIGILVPLLFTLSKVVILLKVHRSMPLRSSTENLLSWVMPITLWLMNRLLQRRQIKIWML